MWGSGKIIPNPSFVGVWILEMSTILRQAQNYFWRVIVNDDIFQNRRANFGSKEVMPVGSGDKTKSTQEKEDNGKDNKKDFGGTARHLPPPALPVQKNEKAFRFFQTAFSSTTDSSKSKDTVQNSILDAILHSPVTKPSNNHVDIRWLNVSKIGISTKESWPRAQFLNTKARNRQLILTHFHLFSFVSNLRQSLGSNSLSPRASEVNEGL